MARDMVVKPSPRRPAPARRVPSGRGQDTRKSKEEPKGRRPTFNLFDPQKRSDAGKRRRHRRPKVEPRVHVLDYGARIPEPFRSLFASAPAVPTPAPQPVERIKDRTVNARSLCRRLFAIRIALEDLSRQAKRYARWGARPVEERRPRRERALRFGWPPGWRVKPTHDVHEILKDCHWLVNCLPAIDTS